jgi:outer membrane protein TolC
MNTKFPNLIVFILFSMGSIFAQQPLQLHEAISKMKENNTQLKVQQQEIDFSQAELAGTLSGFLPKISLSHTGFYTNDPLNSFGFKLQQKVVMQADFNPVLLNNPNEMYHFNTKLSVQQPVLNFDVFSAQKALKEKIKATEYQKQFAEAILTVEIKNAYTNLQFLYEAKAAIQKGILAYQEVLRNTQSMENQGYAKPSDVLMVQVRLTEVQNKEIEIDNNIFNLSDYLSWLMGKDSADIYIPTEKLVQNVVLNENLDFSENRADILAMKSGLEAQNKIVSMNKKGLLPRLNAFGEFNYNDQDIVGFGANGFMVGVSLSWDIFDGNTTFNKIKQSKITVKKAEGEMQLYIEKNQLELQKAKRDLVSNQSKIQLAKTAKEQAEETLRILENRYNQGLEKTSDILVSQATDLEKQVNYLAAVKDYNLSAIQIEFLTQSTN